MWMQWTPFIEMERRDIHEKCLLKLAHWFWKGMKHNKLLEIANYVINEPHWSKAKHFKLKFVERKYRKSIWLNISPVSHICPVYPGGHEHVNRFIPSLHVPWFWHGLLVHSSISIVEKALLYPANEDWGFYLF